MPRSLLAALAAGFALLALAPAPALAAAPPAYVVDGASHGGRCSDEVPAARVRVRRPWCSVGRALAAAPAGATVRVRAGAYPAVEVAGVEHDPPVTVAPYRRERPVVAGITLERVRGVRLSRLVLTTGVLLRDASDVRVLGNEMALTPAGARTESGVILDTVEDVVVRGNWIHDGRDGVNVLGSSVPSRDVVIAGNHFERLGNDGVHVSTGSDILIAGNRFEDVRLRADVDPAAHADGAQIMGPTRNVTVWGNRVTGGRGFLVMVSPRRHGLPGQGHHGLVVANNVLLGPDFGVRTFSTPGAQIVHNTVWGRSNGQFGGVDVRDRHGDANDRSVGVVLAGNVMRRLNVDPAVGLASSTGNVVETGPRSSSDIPGPPAFVDLAAGDVRLAAGSPGAGSADPRLADSLAAGGRSRHGPPDAGALEARAGRVAVGRVARRLRGTAP